MNKFFHLKTHSIMADSGRAGQQGRSTSVGGRSGVGSLGGGSQGPGRGGKGGGGSSALGKIKKALIGEEGTKLGKAIGTFLGALSPVPGGSFLGGKAGAAIQRDIAKGGTGTPEAKATGAKNKGSQGRTAIEGVGKKEGKKATAERVKADLLKESEAEEKRRRAAGGRKGTILAGRAIAEEKQRKSLLGQ